MTILLSIDTQFMQRNFEFTCFMTRLEYLGWHGLFDGQPALLLVLQVVLLQDFNLLLRTQKVSPCSQITQQYLIKLMIYSLQLILEEKNFSSMNIVFLSVSLSLLLTVIMVEYVMSLFQNSYMHVINTINQYNSQGLYFAIYLR